MCAICNLCAHLAALCLIVLFHTEDYGLFTACVIRQKCLQTVFSMVHVVTQPGMHLPFPIGNEI